MSGGNLTTQDLVQLRLAHLAAIQSIISRMGTFSAGIKNLNITIVLALGAFWIQTGFRITAVLVALSTVTLGFLDAYYVSVERKAIALHKCASDRPLADAADIGIGSLSPSLRGTASAMASVSIVGFYLPLLLVVIMIVVFVQPQPMSVGNEVGTNVRSSGAGRPFPRSEK